jgi:hypothetical protein
MTRVLVLFDGRDPVQCDEVAALRALAPAAIEAVALTSFDEGHGPAVPDVVLLYVQGCDVERIAAIRARGWSAPILARWMPLWPSAIPAFHDLYAAVHGIIVAQPLYWERMGRLPRTYAAPPGVEPARGNGSTSDGRVLWVGARNPLDWHGLEAPPRRIKIMSERIGRTIEEMPTDADTVARARWFRSGSIAVLAAPRPDLPLLAVEAALAGCALVAVPGADPFGMVEHGVSGFLAKRTHASILDGMKAALVERERWVAKAGPDIGAWCWSARAEGLLDAIRSAAGAGAPSDARTDLTDAVTVFVTTVGAPSLAACLRHLDAQDCRFRLETIDHVAPMSAAFQRMLDRCATPYYVQVDEDMLLYPWAVRSLHDMMVAAPSDVALLVARLHDAHLDSLIQGLKIFRHGVVRRFPLRDVASFELEQTERMAREGYRFIVLPEKEDGGGPPHRAGPFGLHGTHWTPRSIYERYLTLQATHLSGAGYKRWLEDVVPLFLDRFLEEGSDLDLFALMGVLGATAGGQDCDRSKDFRDYDRIPGFDAFEAFLSDVRKGPTGPKRA